MNRSRLLAHPHLAALLFLLLPPSLLAQSGLDPVAEPSVLPSSEGNVPEPATPPAYRGAPSAGAMLLQEACRDVGRTATPAVVCLSVAPGALDEKRRRFYEEFRKRYGVTTERSEGARRRGRLQAIGSGVVLSSDGYIVTNHHVIDGVEKDSIVVIFPDGERYLADLLGSDKSSDIALLRIYGNGFPTVRLANSDSLSVGSWVLAVGSPLGLRSTVTAGIVSAVGRGRLSEDGNEEGVNRYIQTDAAINPGNSGGGLFDLEGRLVGINSAIYSRTGYFNGYGFAVPSNDMRAVIEDLRDDGRVSRGYVGFEARDLDADQRDSLRLGRQEGVLVEKIEEGGPAATAGLRTGDVVLAVNNSHVSSLDDLKEVFDGVRPGHDLEFLIRRGKRERTIHVHALRSPDEKPGDPLRPAAAALGVVGRVADAGSGLLVEGAHPLGTAWRAGVRNGDRILELGGRSVAGESDVAQALASHHAGDDIDIVFVGDEGRVSRRVVLQPAR